MSTVANLKVINGSDSSVACSVSSECMLRNSNLESFNAKIGPNGGSIAAPVETDASGECAKIQSWFQLAFSSESGYPGGSVTIDLGHGKFKTGVSSVVPPNTFSVSIATSKHERAITVGLLPAPVAMVNSLIWANIPPLASTLKLPPVDIPLPGGFGFKFSATALGGLEQLRCIGAEVSGSAASGVVGKLRLAAPELYTYDTVKIKTPLGSFKINSGLTLKSPQLEAEAVVMSTPENPFRAAIKDLKLVSTTVDVRVGSSDLPNPILTALADAVELAVDSGPVHDYLLQKLNELIPGNR